MNAVENRFATEFGLSGDQFDTLVKLVKKAESAQTSEHNIDSERVRTRSTNAVTAVETFAKDVMKVDRIDWPGLFPVFVKDGHEIHMPD